MPESTLPLNKIAHKELLGAHNVLAFSGGVDSSALFFTLLANDIPFDVAFVNYHTRPSSDLEEAYAKTLCQTYHKQCHVFHAPPIEHNFEATAREIRYAFFVDILARHAYQNLITAHQLNDRFEWFLMRFSKGAGVEELVGMHAVEQRVGYTLVRPFLDVCRRDIEEYLKQNRIVYFEDETNADMTYERNRIRHTWATDFLAAYASGVKRSFSILEDERSMFAGKLFFHHSIAVFKMQMPIIDIHMVVRVLKRFGYVPSKAQRTQIRKEFDCAIAGRWFIQKSADGFIYVGTYTTPVMTKQFREAARVSQIPCKARGILFDSAVHPADFKNDVISYLCFAD